MSKETTEREWAIDVRKSLNKGENQYLDEKERQQKYDAEMKWFRGLPGKKVATRGKVDAKKTAWLESAQKRNPTASKELLERAYESKLRRT